MVQTHAAGGEAAIQRRFVVLEGLVRDALFLVKSGRCQCSLDWNRYEGSKHHPASCTKGRCFFQARRPSIWVRSHNIDNNNNNEPNDDDDKNSATTITAITTSTTTTTTTTITTTKATPTMTTTTRRQRRQEQQQEQELWQEHQQEQCRPSSVGRPRGLDRTSQSLAGSGTSAERSPCCRAMRACMCPTRCITCGRRQGGRSADQRCMPAADGRHGLV